MTLGFLGYEVPIWVLVAGCITLFIAAGMVFTVIRSRNIVDFPVQRRSRLISQAEKKFFEYLKNSLSEDYDVFTKLPMLSVIESSPIASGRVVRLVKKRLVDKQFDFVLCKKSDLSFVGVIELESFDHNKSVRAIDRRKQLVNSICKTARLRLFNFDLRQDYLGVDIRRMVTGKSSNRDKLRTTPDSVNQPSQLTVDNSSYAAFSKKRRCPQCNGEVVTKVATKGERIGVKFLMCRKYPYCDYRVALDDRQVLREIHRERNIVDKQRSDATGFRDWSN